MLFERSRRGWLCGLLAPLSSFPRICAPVWKQLVWICWRCFVLWTGWISPPAEIPQVLLRQLFELDADYVEALWALDQTPGRFKLRATLRDTSAALERMPQLLTKFRCLLPPRAQSTLPALERSVRKSLNPGEAYNMVPYPKSPKRLSTL